MKERYKKNRRSWTDDQLIVAAAECVSMSQVMTALGLKSTAAGNRNTIKKYLLRLEIDVSHWQGQAWVGKREEHPCRLSLEEILVEHSTYKTHHLYKRLINAGLKKRMCEHCKGTLWLGHPIPLEVDHINGINDDHRIENIRFLCPNCHALTPTWRGRNKQGRLAEMALAQL